MDDVMMIGWKLLRQLGVIPGEPLGWSCDHFHIL